ncbi:MAG: hypothetical protein JW829_16465 [Pirellulales bacterium]|nr:hypothetical protein [Pirellulales bacterium]
MGKDLRAIAVDRIIERLVAEEKDRRVAIWLRVRLGGERMTAVALDFGYRDGSGVHRVLQGLEARAKSDRTLARYLKSLQKGNVKYQELILYPRLYPRITMDGHLDDVFLPFSDYRCGL